MINDIFNFFEELLYKWADVFGISYELLNIIIGLIIIPLFIFLLIVIIVLQRNKIRKLSE